MGKFKYIIKNHEIYLLMIIGLSLVVNIDGEIWSIEKSTFVFLFGISVILIAFLYTQFKQNFKIKIGLTDLLLLLFFTYTFVTTLFLKNQSISDSRMFTAFAYIACYIIFRGVSQTYEFLYSGLQVIFLFIVLNSIYGIFQFLEILKSSSPLFKITGTFHNPGIYGGFMALGIPIAIFRIADKEKRTKIVLNVFYLAFITLALFLSASRAAFISATISSFSLLYYKYKPVLFVKCKLPTLIIVVIIVILIATSLALFNINSIVGRLLIWKISLNIFFNNPFFGIGYGQFAIQYGYEQAIFFESNTRSSYLKQIAGMNYYTFNEPLKVLIENGVIGFTVYIMLLIRCFYNLLINIKYKHDSIKTLLATFMCMIVFAQFSYPFENFTISITFFFILSISASYDKKHIFTLDLRFNRYIISVLLIISGLSIFLSFRKLVAINSWKKAQQYLMLRERDSLDIYSSIYPILSNNGTFLFNYGAELISLSNYKKGIEILKQASKYGNNVELHLYLGDAYLATYQNMQAEKEFKLANNMVPNLFVPLEKLLNLYIVNKQYQSAKFIANKIVTQPVKIPSQAVTRIKNKGSYFIRKQTDLHY